MYYIGGVFFIYLSIMKKIVSICITVLLALSFTTESGAQNIMGRLADRARNAIGKKIENAVNNAVGKTEDNDKVADDGKAVERNKPAEIIKPAENDGDLDGIKEFVDRLADINYRKDVCYNNNLAAEEAVRNLEVDALTDVISLIPAFPSANQIINLDPSFNVALHKFSSAANAVAAGYTMLSANVIADPKYSKGTVSASRRAEMNAGAMQIFTAMQKYGIDPEKATDEEMEAFMKKAVADGDIQIQPGKGQAFDMNYTDEQENEIDKVSDKVSALVEAAQNLSMENGFWASTSPFRTTLNAIYDDALSTWTISEAYKKVYDIEKDIDKRAWDYIRSLPESNDIGEEIVFPPFWVQGRKQENVIIREYNMTYLKQWSDKLQSCLEKPIALFKETEAVDAEIEKTFPDKTDLIYANLKGQIGAAIGHISMAINTIMGYAYSAPVIDSVEESRTLTM